MAIADSLLMEMDMEEKTTQRVLDRVPEDKLTWKPHPKSYSLGQLAMHIAVAQGRVAAAAEEDVHDITGDNTAPQPKSRKEILDTFSASTMQAKQIIKSLDDAKMMSAWSLRKNGKVVMALPRIGFLRAILLNHLYHHRGQLSVYLRLLDVPVPSIYGPSADENPFG
jgi:uncharacterized damage-inducible protein DinB